MPTTRTTVAAVKATATPDPTPTPEATVEQLRPATVFGAMNMVMRQVRAVTKDQKIDPKARMGNWSFRGIDDVINAVGPALRDCGVMVVPHKVLSHEVTTVTVGGDKKTTMASVRVKVRYRWYGPAGDFVDTESVGESFDSGDKGTTKAMSVAFRTNMIQTLCLPTDERDPDSDAYQLAPEGTTHGRDPEREQDQAPEAPRGPSWRQRYDVAVNHGTEGLTKFIAYAKSEDAPLLVVETAQNTLAEMQAQEERVKQANRAGQQGPANPGTPESRGEAVKSMVPDAPEVKQAAAQFTTRLNACLAEVPVNLAKLDRYVDEAYRHMDATNSDIWTTVYQRARDEYARLSPGVG